MSAFSNVDGAVDPGRLVSSLEESARGLSSMKHYMAAAHALHSGFVLDIGCGAGHDMAVLDDLGVSSVGVDPSEVMVLAARTRTPGPTARAVGERLPFRDDSFAGCWIERVLMHVADPVAVLREAVRCIVRGGLVTVFEPDWSSLTVNGRRIPTAWLTKACHPEVGSDIGSFLQEVGCFVRDRVEERSWWTFPQFEAITKGAVFRTATSAPDTLAEVADWLAAVRASVEDRSFTAEMVKVMWLATKT